MKVVGYLDRFSYRPGDQVTCMVSAETGPVTVDVVRLIHGDTSPAGPGFRSRPVPGLPPQVIAARVQRTHPGSCLLAADVLPAGTATVRLSLWAWPTLPQAGGPQGLLSLVTSDGQAVLSVALDADGRLHVRDSDGRSRCPLPRPLLARRWYRIEATLGAGGCELSAHPLHAVPGDAGTMRAADQRPADLIGATGVVVAAVQAMADGSRPRPVGAYNGKLERPTLVDAGSGAALTNTVLTNTVLAEWAFDREPAAARVLDVSGRERHATVLNLPARAMTGHRWTGEVLDFTRAPEQYGAIHFHDDDVSDAGWEPSTSIKLPAGLRSGVYAVRLRTESEIDHVPFAVLPPASGRTARLAYLLPSFTYAAYANLLPKPKRGEPVDPRDEHLTRHREYGTSLYDLHRDGSGVCYSSLARPVVNLRPDHRCWLTRSPRHFGADLYLVDWLEHFAFDYDVLTDHDLHEHGAELLRGYQVVATGSHPEYHSGRMLDAFDEHVGRGGCLMYLGGNGFYWVTTQQEQHPHAVEVRRTAGTRTWQAEPGEGHHSTTGEPGGLWRWRGRSPNVLTGIGMAAQGWDASVGYRRTPASHEPQWAWLFDGVRGPVIGDHGLIMGGASGDEVDRVDARLGSPPQTVVLATSVPHSGEYFKVVEDVLAVAGGLSGQASADVRSDLVIVEQVSGGAVFSVGSIAFLGSLSHNHYDNDVSRLVHNALTNFLGRGTA